MKLIARERLKKYQSKKTRKLVGFHETEVLD